MTWSPASNHGTRALAWARLLLLAALLLGVGAMHTLGHPHEEASATTGHAGHGMVAVAAEATPTPGDTEAGLAGLDPTTMCLALAAAFTALLGLAAAFVRWPGTFLPPFFPSVVARAAPCLARPPAPPTLAALQVLRI